MNDKQLRKATVEMIEGEGKAEGIAKRKSEAHVREEMRGAGKEPERGDIKSGPPKLRRNGGSSSSHHP